MAELLLFPALKHVFDIKTIWWSDTHFSLSVTGWWSQSTGQETLAWQSGWLIKKRGQFRLLPHCKNWPGCPEWQWQVYCAISSLGSQDEPRFSFLGTLNQRQITMTSRYKQFKVQRPGVGSERRSRWPRHCKDRASLFLMLITMFASTIWSTASGSVLTDMEKPGKVESSYVQTMATLVSSN